MSYIPSPNFQKRQRVSSHIHCVSVNNTSSFVYGGWDGFSVVFNDLYVLTIPGFVWFQVTSDEQSTRVEHTCEVIGRRQMAVIGGLSNPSSWIDPDPFTQGLGVFDMSNMTWSSSYSANADAYETPEPVKSWYYNG